MNWLIFIIIIGVIGALIGYFSSDGNESEAKEGCLSGLGCGTYIVIQIILAIVGLYLIFQFGAWLFG